MTLMNVGIAYAGDAEDPTARSGSPYGVLTGVRGHGIRAQALNASFPRNVDRAVAAVDAVTHLATSGRRLEMKAAKLAYSGAHLARLTSLSRSAALRIRRGVRSVDGIIALGSGYEIPAGVPYVLYDDMTVQQAVDLEYPVWMAMRESDRRFRLDQQRRIYRNAVMCCMETSWGADSALEDYGISPERVVVVGAGTHDLPRDVQRDWSVPRFLFIGLDWERKNGARVLDAFARVRRLHPEATLDVVGGHPVIEQDGVRPHGRLFRDRPDDLARLTALYDQATCFVMPSIHEPGGVVLLEAAAAGVGSVAGNRGGSADFVGDAGMTVDPFSDDQIFAAMSSFTDAAVAAERGRLSAERSRSFTWPQVAGRLLKALDPTVPIDSQPLPVRYG